MKVNRAILSLRSIINLFDSIILERVGEREWASLSSRLVFFARFGETISHQDPVLRSTFLLSKDHERTRKRERSVAGCDPGCTSADTDSARPAVPQRNRTRDQIFLPLPSRIYRGRNMCTDIERSRTPPASIFAETETKRVETFPRICVKWKSSRKNCYSFPTRIKDPKSKTFKRKIFYQEFTGIFCQKFSMLTRRSPV